MACLHILPRFAQVAAPGICTISHTHLCTSYKINLSRLERFSNQLPRLLRASIFSLQMAYYPATSPDRPANPGNHHLLLLLPPPLPTVVLLLLPRSEVPRVLPP